MILEHFLALPVLRRLQKEQSENFFATSVGENAVHGSDSDENSVIETRFHFSDREVF